MIFRPRQAAIAERTANDEAPCGIDEKAGILEPFIRQGRPDDLFNDPLDELRLRNIGMMLRRNNDIVDTMRLAIDVADRHLRFGVGAQEW